MQWRSAVQWRSTVQWFCLFPPLSPLVTLWLFGSFFASATLLPFFLPPALPALSLCRFPPVAFRLADNTYVGTFGAGGYGAKANDILSKVRGKDFRHEKTKKKRGTYRGGIIDVNAVHSVKLSNDDE